MTAALRAVALSTILFGLSGCASNSIVGHGTVQAGRYAGELGIAGNGTTVTIQPGSHVTKLSVVGDGSKVTVEDGAEVYKIEFWGNGNTVSIPDSLQVIVAAMGTNQVVRRTAAAAEPGSP